MADFLEKLRLATGRATRALFGVVVFICAFSTTNSFADGYVCSSAKQYTSCSAGYYMTYNGSYDGTPKANNACTICPAGYKCTGGTANKVACSGELQYQDGTGKSSCKSVSTGYYKSSNSAQAQCPANYRSGAGAATQAGCQTSCSAGQRVSTANAACASTTPDGGASWWTSAHNVYYGRISPVNYCMAGYTTNNASTATAANHDAKADCVKTIAGKYVASTTIPVRYIKQTSSGSNSNAYNHVVEIQAFASNDGSGTNLLSGKGGTSGSNLTSATDGSWARSPYASGQQIIWDLGSSQNIGSIKFAMYTDGRVYTDVTIQVSTDNSNWTTVFGGTGTSVKTDNASTATGELIVLTGIEQNCAAGKYKASSSVSLNSTTSCSSCEGRTKYSAAGAASCSDVSSGHYTTGCNSSSNECTGQTQCTGSTYCVSGVQINCPSADSGWTLGTGTGWTARTSCFEYQTPANCASGSVQRNGNSSANSYSSTITLRETLKANANSWTTTTATSCSTCPTAYPNSAANTNSGQGACYKSCSAGNYWNGTNQACAACTAGNWCAGTTAYYTTSSNQGLSACSTLGSGYTSAGGTGDTANTKCYLTLSGKVRSGTSGTTTTDCNSGKYKGSHNEYYGTSYSCDTCSAGTYSGTSGAITSCSNCEGRTKYSGTGASSCSTVTSGYYTTGCNGSGNNCTDQSQCTAGYYCSGGVRAECAGGKYSSTSGATSCSNITAGYYCAGGAKTATPSSTSDSVSGKSCGGCSGLNSYSGAGASSCSAPGDGYYTTGCNSSNNLCTGRTQCESGSYCKSGVKTACTTTSGWTTASAAGSSAYTACYQTRRPGNCSTGNTKRSASSISGTTITYGTEAVDVALGANAGYYVNGLVCSACGGNNYYCAGGTATRKTVDSGYYSTGGDANTRTGQSACEAGYYCSSGVRNECGGATYSTGSATSCSSINTGYFSSGGGKSATPSSSDCLSGKSCGQCPSGYRNIAASSQNGCVGTFSKSGSQTNPTQPSSWYSRSLTDCTPGSCNYTKNYGGSVVSDCTPTNCERTQTATACNSGYYLSSGSCPACSGLASGFYPNSAAGNSSGSSACYTNSISGQYVAKNASSATNCGSADKYKGSHTVNYGSSSSCDTVTAGYYTTGGTSTTRTGQSACGGNQYYCSGGVRNDVSSGYYSTGGTETTRTGQSQCTTGNYCSGGVSNACTSYRANTTTTGNGKTSSSDCLCVSGKYLSGTTCTNTSAGYYSGVSNDQTQCEGRTKYSAGGAGSCSTVDSGYYTTGCNSSNNQCTGQSACGGNAYYCSGGVRNDVTSGYYTTGGTSTTRTGQSACGGNQYYCSGGVRNDVSSGYYSTGGTETTRTGQSQCTTGNYCSGGVSNACTSYRANTTTTGNGKTSSSDCVCKAGMYLNSSSVCTTTETGYYSGVENTRNACTSYRANTTTNGTGKSASSDCLCVGGKYLSGTTCTNTSAGYYSGVSNDQTACSGRTKYSGGGVSSCSDVSSGYYTTGCNDSGNACTGQTQCSGSTYCASGVQNNCPTADSGWTLGTGTGWTARTSCYEYQTPANCASGSVQRNGNSSANSYSSTITLRETLKANANSWTTTTATSCSTCPTAYPNSAANTNSGQGACYKSCSAGNYWNGTNQACTACAAGNWCAGTTAYYTTTSNQGLSACSTLGSGYTSAGGTGDTANTKCYLTLSGKVRSGTSGTTTTDCNSGKYKGSHNEYYGTSYSCDTCSAGTYSTTSGAITSCSNCEGRTKYSGSGASSCSTVTSGYYTTGCNSSGNLCTGQSQCTGRTKYCSSGVENTVSSGYYTTGCNSSNNGCTGQTQCSGSTYCASGVQNNCPTADSGWTAGTGTGWTARTSCFEYQTPANCASGSVQRNGNSSANSYSSTITLRETLKANANSWTTTTATSCSTCPTAYPNSAANTNSGQGACYKSCSAGNYWNGTNQACAACTAGNWCAGTTAYYTTSSNQGLSACSTLGSGYTSAGGTGDTANTKCYLPVAAGKVRSGTSGTTLTTCSAGTYKAGHNAYYGTSYSCSNCEGRTKYSAAGAGSCSTVSSGYYTTGCTSNNNCTGESQCTGSTYCSGGVQNNCPTADSGWTAGTGTGWTEYGNCYEKKTGSSISSYCSAGELRRAASSTSAYSSTVTTATALKAVKGAYVNGQTCSQCTGATYQATDGSTATSCSACPTQTSGWTRGTGTGWTAVTSCYETRTPANCASGTIKHNATDSSTWGSASVTSALSANAGYYVNSTACSACGGNGYYCTGGTAARATVSSGYYSTGGDSNTRTGQSQCTGATYCSGGVQSNCPTGYNANTIAGKTSNTQCDINVSGGHYIGTAGQNSSNWGTCGAAYYAEPHTVHYGSTSTCGSCPTGYSANSATGKAAISECQITCAAGNYIASGTYTQVAYLTSTGTQYINTGVKTSYGLTVTARFSTSTQQTLLVGGRVSDAGQGITWGYPTSNTAWHMYGSINGSAAVTKNVLDGQEHTVVLSSTGLTLDGVAQTHHAFDEQVGSNDIYLFTWNNSGSADDRRWKGNVYGLSITDANGNMIRNMIPVRRNSDSVLGMLDLVSGTFFTNAGSGTFTAGSDVGVIGGTCSAVGSGYYAAAATIGYGSTAPRSTCPTNYGNSGSGASSQNDCYLTTTAKKYVATAGAGETDCVAGTYCAGGTTIYYGGTHSSTHMTTGGSATCPAGSFCVAKVSAATACSSLSGVSPTGGTYTSAAGSTANTACKYTAPSKTITGCKTVTSQTVTYSGSAWPASTYGVTANKGYVIANNNKSNATCSICTGATYQDTDGSTATSCTGCPTGYTANTDNGKTANTQCQISVSGGHYIAESGQTSSNWGTCANWTYKAVHSVNYGSISSCDGTCPAAETSSGWAKGTGTGWSAVTNCYETKAAPNCKSGTLQKNATNSTTWGSSTIASALTANAGSYVNGQQCSSCGAGTYTSSDNQKTACDACSGGTQYQDATGATSCKTVSNGYYKSSNSAQTQCPANYQSGAGAATQAGCTASCAAKSAITTANGACTTQGTGYWAKAHTVTYGNTSVSGTDYAQCPENYRDGAVASAQSGCAASCSAGYAVVEANGACTSIQNSTYKGKYIGANTVTYGNTSSISDCPTNYKAANGTTAQSNCETACSAGTQVATQNNACSTPTGNNWYTAAHNVKYGNTSGSTNVKSCKTGYTTANSATATDHDAQGDCKISCGAGYYIPTAGGGCVACTGGKYCSAISDIAETATSAVTGNITAGYFCAGGAKTATPTSSSDSVTSASCGKCTSDSTTGRQTYSGAGASSCSICPEVQSAMSSRFVSYGGWWSNNIHNAIGGCAANFNDSETDDDTKYIIWCMYSVSDGGYGGANSYCQTRKPTSCAAGTYNTIQSTAQWVSDGSGYAQCNGVDCMKGKVCTDTDAGYYSPANDLTQTQCPTGYPNSVSGSDAITDCYSNTKSRAWTGSAVNGTTPTGCTVTAWNSCSNSACDYVAYANAVGTGDGTIKSGCSTNSDNCTKTVKTVSANNGYYAASNATSCTACPTLTSGYSYVSGTGWNTYSQCKETKSDAACASGALTKTADSASTWATAVSTLSAGSNKYVTGSGDSTTCTSCPTAYPNSAGGTGGVTQCFSGTKSRAWTGSQTACSNPDTTGCSGFTCGTCSNPACDYVAYANAAGNGDGTIKSGCSTNNTACQKPVASLTAKANYYVNGTTSCPTCTSKNSSYPKSDGGDIGYGKCYVEVVRGCTKNNGSTPSNCSVTAYNDCSCTGDTYKSYADSTTSGTTTNETCIKTVKTVSANAGYYVDGLTCPICTGVGGGLYPNSNAGNTGGASACYTDEISGKYVAANATVATNCAAGSYKGAHQVNYGSSSSCNPCAAGTYAASAGMTACTAASKGYYVSGTGQTSQSACFGGKYQDETGQSSCKTCPAAYPNGNWAITSINSCYRSCMGGTYMANINDTTCTDVGTGYWAAYQDVSYGNTGIRTACPAGTTTTGSGYGADEAGDCGRILHTDDTTVRLRSVKKTDPAFNVKIGETTYYGNMSTTEHMTTAGSSKALRVKDGSDSYYVYDDTAMENRGYPWDAVGFDINTNGSTYTYSAANMTWNTTFSWGKAYGIAACNTNNGSWATASPNEQTNSGGTKCWCKLTSVAGVDTSAVSSWVFLSTLPSAANCASACANNCGDNVRMSSFRSGVFSAVGD